MTCDHMAEQYTTADGMSYLLTIEDAPIDYDHTFPPVRANDTPRRAYRSTVLALIMAILGSSVLPVAYAFSKTGIVPGIIISLVRRPSHHRFCNRSPVRMSATVVSEGLPRDGGPRAQSL
jgi:hypothetical protein